MIREKKQGGEKDHDMQPQAIQIEKIDRSKPADFFMRQDTDDLAIRRFPATGGGECKSEYCSAARQEGTGRHPLPQRPLRGLRLPGVVLRDNIGVFASAPAARIASTVRRTNMEHLDTLPQRPLRGLRPGGTNGRAHCIGSLPQRPLRGLRRQKCTNHDAICCT